MDEDLWRAILAEDEMMDEELLDQSARLKIVRSLCGLQNEFHFKQSDIDQLFRLIRAICSDGEALAEVDRNSRLATALKQSYGVDHPVWAFCKWGRAIPA